MFVDVINGIPLSQNRRQTAGGGAVHINASVHESLERLHSAAAAEVTCAAIKISHCYTFFRRPHARARTSVRAAPDGDLKVT